MTAIDLIDSKTVQSIERKIVDHFSVLGCFPEHIRLRNSNSGRSSRILISQLTSSVNDYLQQQGIVERDSRATREVLGYVLVSSFGYEKSTPNSVYAFDKPSGQ